MEKARTLPSFDSLSRDRQEAVERTMARLKREYEIPGEILGLDELARVLGLKPKALWNLRARGKMPAIPVRRVGGHDGFWIGHVAMWLMAQAGSLAWTVSADSSEDIEPTKTTAKKTKENAPGLKSDVSVAKAALMARANELFEQKLRERK
ncbi:MAG: hypothetical protein CK604_06190 [Curvibacter sp. PD_MW3]|nr:MAG: hypothetical protein CK604_06190 [Curvibacter sp. PD_MW3]